MADALRQAVYRVTRWPTSPNPAPEVPVFLETVDLDPNEPPQVRQTRTDQNGVERRLVGWECVHIAIDDATRLAYAEVLPDERATTAIAFLRRAVTFYERHGMKVQELLTDG